MEDTSKNKHISIGILAHVDAGKTTLSESLLYISGSIRKPGRVDHGDAYLDTYELERERGITIFSKQAILPMGDKMVTLLDTPGHVDFSAEMERTLQVMDYAILVINGSDGVQGHTATLWKLLKRYGIPVFLFVNKMDQEGTDQEILLKDLKKRLHENCIDFSEEQDRNEFLENLAVCDEEILENFLETGEVEETEIIRLIRKRKVFPCYFGSALRLTGVEEFWKGMERYTEPRSYPEEFGAKVYKIARDDQGNRLTYMKITGGSLKVKTLLTNQKPSGGQPVHFGTPEEVWEEKADQLRIYSGIKYELIKEAEAGSVCAVTGLTRTYPGQGLGIEKESELPLLEPVLNYRIILPDNCDVHQMLKKLKELEEEDPQLHIVWDSILSEIHVMLMGEVQTEVLKRLIWERFHTTVDFDAGRIVYKETIAEPVEGVGHFEPLRHYAEVHLLLEPGERGSGLQFFTACSEDMLSRNWQRLVLTHLEEKEHKGVLTGAPLTDVQITLITGKAHLKHTEGGDFRQATYRAVRHGLKKAKNILLEPYYEFRLEVPAENIGRAMSDIQKMQGSFLPPDQDGEMAVLRGSAAVSAMRDYQKEVLAYTGGRGRLFCGFKGYEPCKEQDRIVQETGYDSERDLENPTGSVFCSHGAGFVVPWNQVEEYMHLEGMEGFRGESQTEENVSYVPPASAYRGSYEEEKELQEIFERTFGSVKRDRSVPGKRVIRTQDSFVYRAPSKKTGEEYLLVDGYNIIFSWDDLKELAESDIHAAQDKLMDILSNYQGIKKCTLILVFDAYKVEGHREEILEYHNIHVVYTKEAETADQYIEKTVHKIGRNHHVTVATSDGLEQIIIMGQGAVRLSAKGLQKEIEEASRALLSDWYMRRKSSRSYLFDDASDEVKDFVERAKKGETEK